ncbi:hypothetical protein ZHAS_00010522 [Anopheles sinensis]|uniref:Uncharacterized protein n=1 Tax=Anopheles sinensis TaxID=74873 RepID=A0A084VXT2_ANOSI|nr:hypothetical protein ZHAS_00010522 [Anopheles sinensis]
MAHRAEANTNRREIEPLENSSPRPPHHVSCCVMSAVKLFSFETIRRRSDDNNHNDWSGLNPNRLRVSGTPVGLICGKIYLHSEQSHAVREAVRPNAPSSASNSED